MALRLRAEGCRLPIVLLGGVYGQVAMRAALQQRINLVVHQDQLEDLLALLDSRSLAAGFAAAADMHGISNCSRVSAHRPSPCTFG